MAAAGTKVCVLDLAHEAGSALAVDLAAQRSQAIAVRTDATQKAELESALAEIIERLGPPAILVNSTQFRRPGLL